MDGQRRLGTETVHVVHFSGQRKSNLEIRKSMKRRKRLPEGEEERRYASREKRGKEKRIQVEREVETRRETRTYSLDDLCGSDAISKASLESSPSLGTTLLVNHRDPPTHQYRSSHRREFELQVRDAIWQLTRSKGRMKFTHEQPYSFSIIPLYRIIFYTEFISNWKPVIIKSFHYELR